MKKAGKPPRRRVLSNGRSKDNPRHVRWYRWMTSCPAFLDLDPYATRVLLELYMLFNGSNNGEIFLSIREGARRCGIAKNTVSRALKSLVSHGFIRRRAEEPIHFNLREARCWILTEFGFGGRAPTKDFMEWRPLEEK